MTIIFRHLVKHDGRDLWPQVAVDFEDDRAEEYFIAAGWADATDDPPVVTYPAGSIAIDPETVFAVTGVRVLGEG